jgi:hypothetical protein
MQQKKSLSTPGAFQKQGFIFPVLLVLGILYFTLFIFPNATGARTPEMLQVFQVDEFAQYPNVIHMLTPGDTPIQTLRNFIIYLHYFYGYIFYFVSALFLLPLRLALGSRWTDHTPLLVDVLRQGVSVLPALVSVFLLTYMATGFRFWLRSLSIFILLLSVPALVENNLWWHPDSLGLLLVVLIFFFLDRDRLRFGCNFFIAAAFCGVAVGTKYLGVFFALTILLYLTFGIACQKITWRRAALLAPGFVLVMAAAVVATNPLLLMPQERAALIHYQFLQYQQTMSGILVHNSTPFFENGQYPAGMRINYGDASFVLLAILAIVIGLLRSSTRLRASLMLVFMAPLSYTIINAATRRAHYWLPVLIPLFSCLVFLFPEPGPENSETEEISERFRYLKRILPWLGMALIATQLFVFIQTDTITYMGTLQREATSPSLAFNQQIDHLLTRLPQQNKKYVAYRDWHIYFPDDARWRVEMTWDLTTDHFIREVNPDLILFEQDNVTLYNTSQAQENAVNPEDMKLARELYQSASADQLPGYHLFYRDNFGIALIRDNLAQYLK